MEFFCKFTREYYVFNNHSSFVYRYLYVIKMSLKLDYWRFVWIKRNLFLFQCGHAY